LERAKETDESSVVVRELLAQIVAKTELELAKTLLLEESKLPFSNKASVLRSLWRLDPSDKLVLQRALRWDPSAVALWKELAK
jgi:hypothetical protein